MLLMKKLSLRNYAFAEITGDGGVPEPGLKSPMPEFSQHFKMNITLTVGITTITRICFKVFRGKKVLGR